jgi:hypothetical protein
MDGRPFKVDSGLHQAGLKSSDGKRASKNGVRPDSGFRANSGFF